MDELTTSQNVAVSILAVICLGGSVLLTHTFMTPKIDKLRARVKELSAPPLEHSEITRRATRAVRALEAATIVIKGIASEEQYTPNHADDLRATLASLQLSLNDLNRAAESITANAGQIETDPK